LIDLPPWQFTPYAIPLALATAVATVGAVIAWRQREGPTEVWGAVSQLAIALWAALHLLTVSSTTLEWKLSWLLLLPPVIALDVVSLFCFTVYFTGHREWLTRPRVGALLALPAVAAVVSATGGSHELLLVDPRLDTSGEFAVLSYELGPAFYAVLAVGYAITAAFVWLLVRKLRGSRNVYRKITFVIVTSIVIMAGATLVSAAQRSPLPHFMLFPLAYLLLGLVVLPVTLSARYARAVPVDRVYTAVSSRFGDIVPLARDFIVEEIDSGILVLDADGRIVDVNPIARKMIGVERPVGKHLRDVPQPDRIIEWGKLGAMLNGDRPLGELRDEIWIDSANGERCYDVSISSIGDADDDSVGYVVLLHDITDQKRREETLRERERELEQQKQRLQRRTTQLEHQNERLDRFAGIVSHDLRNPLNVASGYLESVDVDDTEGTVELEAETIEAVAESHERMQTIIDDALELARQGKAITDTRRVRLPAVAEEAWGNVDTADAALSLECECFVYADRDRLLTLLENLFRNSVEHAARDAAVRVGCLDDGGESPDARETASGFYVEDDGPGIPDERKEEVLNHGFTTSEDGTGFGLTIVNDVASAHGWDLALADGEDGGLRVELTGVERIEADE